jgi:hypothetical protein
VLSRGALGLLLFENICHKKLEDLNLMLGTGEKGKSGNKFWGEFVLQTINRESGCTKVRPLRTEGDMSGPPTIYGQKR